MNRRVEAQSPQLWSCGLFYLSSLPTLSCPLFSHTFSTRKNTTYSMWGTPMIFQIASFYTTKAMHLNLPQSFDPGRSFSPSLFLLEQLLLKPSLTSRRKTKLSSIAFRMTKTYKNSFFKNSTPKLPSHCRAHAPRGRDPEFNEGSSSSRARFSVNRRVEAQSPANSVGLFYF